MGISSSSDDPHVSHTRTCLQLANSSEVRLECCVCAKCVVMFWSSTREGCETEMTYFSYSTVFHYDRRLSESRLSSVQEDEHTTPTSGLNKPALCVSSP